MNIIVSGGGTGGHVFPALAIADYFKGRIDNCNVIYVGAKGAIEEKIVPQYGYPLETLDLRGIQRKISLENLKRGMKALLSLRKCRKLLKDNKIDLVIGTGGYASGPVTYIAQTMKIKTAIHEQNVFMGVTNKILAKKADFVFCGFKETVEKFPNINAVYTGNPVKISEDNIDIRERHGINKKDKIILIVGGSGGSKTVNNSVVELLSLISDKKDVTVIHSTGRTFYEEIKEKTQKINLNNYICMPFIDRMGNYISECDIAVGSSGASSIAEYNYYKKPIIAIPKAFTAENHQEFNARSVENNGAGVCILEKDLNGQVLYDEIFSILEDKTKLKKMSENSGKLYNDKTLEIIFNSIMRVIK